MKRIGLLLVVIVLSKVGYDQIMRNIEKGKARRVDEQMEKIAQEMNAKTPFKGPSMTITGVEYSQHVLRFSAVASGDNPSAQAKAEFERSARTMYCSGKLATTKVGVEYELLGPPRSLDDLTREKWVVSLGPQSC